MDLLNQLKEKLGIDSWFGYQLDCFDYIRDLPTGDTQPRLCLFYKTGAGKTVTALISVWLLGHNEALVIAPPSTHAAWVDTGAKIGMNVECMSHAKFREKGTKLSRKKALIVDEFHLLGKNTGKGFLKLDRLAPGMQAPVILASATPNYNDAERVYCIQHVLDPLSCRGGFLEFIYQHCITEHNPFSMTPNVIGFRHFADAKSYLAALPQVQYLEDDLVYKIQDEVLLEPSDSVFKMFGYDQHKHRIMASDMETRHRRAYLNVCEPDGKLRVSVVNVLNDYLRSGLTPLLVYCDHSTIAEAIDAWLYRSKGISKALVTGKTTTSAKADIIERFNRGEIQVLIGTASLATGTDGMDKVCNHLLIVDDTSDDSLRRQLIGRIMPRGAGGNVASKSVKRLRFA